MRLTAGAPERRYLDLADLFGAFADRKRKSGEHRSPAERESLWAGALAWDQASHLLREAAQEQAPPSPDDSDPCCAQAWRGGVAYGVFVSAMGGFLAVLVWGLLEAFIQ